MYTHSERLNQGAFGKSKGAGVLRADFLGGRNTCGVYLACHPSRPFLPRYSHRKMQQASCRSTNHIAVRHSACSVCRGTPGSTASLSSSLNVFTSEACLNHSDTWIVTIINPSKSFLPLALLLTFEAVFCRGPSDTNTARTSSHRCPLLHGDRSEHHCHRHRHKQSEENIIRRLIGQSWNRKVSGRDRCALWCMEDAWIRAVLCRHGRCHDLL